MGVTVAVDSGDTLFEAAAAVGVDVDTVCGGNGLCGKCKIRVTDPGAVAALPIDEIHVPADQIADGFRLSCQIRPESDLVVDVPEAGRRTIQILHTGLQREVALRPNVLKIHIPHKPPRDRDGVADWDAVRGVLPSWFGRVDLPLDWLRKLPALSRDSDGMTLSVVNRQRITRIESGDTSSSNHGIAVDIGSTSVVAYLLDLSTGEELAVASGLNLQAAYGDDIIARLSKAQFDPAGLAQLHNLIIEQLNMLFAEVLATAGLETSAIADVTIVGNMAMHHFLLQLDSTYLGLSPYAPVTRDAVMVTASELALDLQPDTPIYVLPNIAGFLGSDTVGLALASGLMDADEFQMAVDVGTNGEVVLGRAGRVLACSAPAGPAFEGARIKHGMRATAGAIDHVSMSGDVEVSVIGDKPPSGICGSALIDIAAAMLDAGLAHHSGRLMRHDELGPQVAPALRERLVDGAKRRDSFFRLVREGENDAPREIVFTQQDLREFQLAKGAIRAGQMVLQRILEIDDDALGEVVLAGAFGSYIDRENAKRVNLVPQIDRIRSVGNGAGVGAKLALLSSRERRRAEQIAAATEHVRLSGLDDFQKVFPYAMRFPENANHGGR